MFVNHGIDTFILSSADVKVLNLSQQLVVYFIPLIANLQVINTAVVFVRLHWFKKRFKDIGTFLISLLRTFFFFFLVLWKCSAGLVVLIPPLLISSSVIPPAVKESSAIILDDQQQCK